MTEQNLSDDELEVVEENDVLLDGTPGAAASFELDPVTGGEPDNYPGAAENNPHRWQEDPLLQDEVSGEEEDFLSDQTLRDDTKATRDGAAENFGGSRLSEFEPDDLER